MIYQVGRWFGVGDQWQRPAPQVGLRDTAVAAITTVATVLTYELVRAAFPPDGVQPSAALAYSLAVAGGALLLGRRRFPLLIALAATVHMFVVGTLAPVLMASLPMQLVYFVAFMSVVAWSRDRAAMVFTMTAVLIFMFVWVTWQYAVGSGIDQLRSQFGSVDGSVTAIIIYVYGINAVYFLGAIALGQSSWRSARNTALLAQQAHEIARQATKLQHQAIVAERLRIAQDIHDIVAHHVSAIGIHAAGARRVLDRTAADREGITEIKLIESTLTTINDEANEAVDQMRYVVGSLRDFDDSERDEAGTAFGALPTIADLEQLVTEAQRPSTRTFFTLVDDGVAADSVPEALVRVLYRTVQEALTNVTRHSTATRVLVTVRLKTYQVEVEIVDNGRPLSNTSGSGLGQLGIRERVRSLGGSCDIGPRILNGYRVRAVLPIASGANTTSVRSVDPTVVRTAGGASYERN